jgi:hypothetical protein
MEESSREYNTVIGPHASGGGCTQAFNPEDLTEYVL